MRNSVAWNNPRCGFDYNGNDAAIEVLNSTSLDNGSGGFCFENKSVAVLRNNVAADDQVRLGEEVDAASNAWEISTAQAQDFLSVDTSLALAAREADGSLPENKFLRPTSNSRLVDAGQDVGLPFSGSAPDLGAFEVR